MICKKHVYLTNTIKQKKNVVLLAYLFGLESAVSKELLGKRKIQSVKQKLI